VASIASLPTATFSEPVVHKLRVDCPTAVLLPEVVAEANDPTPTATLKEPVVSSVKA